MKRVISFFAVAVSVLLITGNASAMITIDTVGVGNAGNAADQNYFGQGSYGAVDYDYAIGKYEVTLDQYNTFLNAVAVTDTYGLYDLSMGNANTRQYVKGIAQSGIPGSFSYAVIGNGNRPVTFVSWFDAARFVNWLHNGQPSGLQTAATTEDGAYTLNGALAGVNFTKNAGAKYWIPSEHEWYKAAYYQPASQGGDADNYWLYPTKSNDMPNSRNGSATDPNSANIIRDDGIANGFNGGYAVNNSTAAPVDNALTEAGAFSQASSFYGTFDQAGNVWEWTDGVFSGSSRVMRGGAWSFDGGYVRASHQDGFHEDLADDFLGFRIATIPEPGFAGFVVLGMAMLVWRRKLEM